jgi:hypothetical protein
VPAAIKSLDTECQKIPKGQNIQPTMKTFAHLSLDQITGETSAQNAT